MRTHFLQSVLGLTVLGAALVACGDDGSGSGGGGGGSTEATGSTGVPASGSTVTGTGVVASSSGTDSGPAPVSSSAGGDCAGLSPFMDGFYTDPATNSCVQSACCDELAACGDPEAGDMACFNGDGMFDTSLPAAAALDECAYGSGCLGAIVCDSGIGFNGEDQETLDFAACLSTNCCEEMNFCTSDAVDIDACIECLQGDAANFDLCEPVNNCSLQNCEQGLVFIPICDSGLGTADIQGGECADENCCEPYVACTGGANAAGEPNDEEQLQECLDCLIEGGGELCDDAIACEEENCSQAICESGITVGDIELATCLTESCCTEFTTCTGGDLEDEEAVNACIDCYNEALESGEPAELCAAAFNCADTNCGDGEGGGGTGGSGAGGDGTGGAGGAGGGI
jgi:hypothetical protein